MKKYCVAFNYAFAIVFCIVSIAIGFFSAQYGLFIGDESFHILNFMDVHDSTMAPGAALIYGSFGRLFDFNYLRMRLMSVASVNLALVIAGLYYYARTRRLLRAFYLVGISALLMNLPKHYWYTLVGWDSICVLMSVVTIVALLCYIRRPSFARLGICVLVVGVTSIIRIPNIIAVPIFIIVVFFADNGHGWKKYCKALVAGLAAPIAAGIIIAVAYNGIGGYIASLKTVTVTDHSMFGLLYINIYHLVYFTMIGCIFVVAFMVFKSVSGRWLYLAGLLIIFVLLFLSMTDSSFGYPRIISSGFLLLLCYTAYTRRSSNKDLLGLFVILSCCYLTACGSNNGLTKYLTLPAIPLLALYMGSTDKRPLIATVSAVVLVLVLVAIKSNIIFACGTKLQPQPFDSLMPPRLSGMKLQQEQADEINGIYESLRKYVKDDHRNFLLICPGQERFVWEQVFNYRNPVFSRDFDAEGILDDQCNIDYVVGELNGESAVEYVFLITPQGSCGDSRFEKEILNHTSILEQCPTHTVYKVCRGGY